ncbi:Folate family ECF transporter S component [Ruminococcaceae bacterium BL-6]|nr:Folate family ECF transporter S component [Ruminococcaceae bacterium BL-6]
MSKNNVFPIFTSKYWAAASSEFRNLRSLVFAGLTVALGTVLSSISIPVGMNLHITFAFVVLAFGSMVFGPVVGLSAGVAYDLVGFLMMPSSVFFPGYTLSSMLEFFIYGVFLYRCRISVVRVFLCKLMVDFGIHVGFGSLWSQILFGKGYYYFFIKSLVKNAVMLPVEVLMLLVLLRIFLPVLEHGDIVPKRKSRHIPFL